MASPIVGVLVINSIWLGFTAYRKIAKRNGSVAQKIYLAGSVSGFFNSFVACPMELDQIAESSCQLWIPIIRRTCGLYSTNIPTQHAGIAGFYRAMHCTMWRETPSYGVYFASYELLCRKLVPAGTPTNVPTPALLVAGGLAGVVAWLVTYPFDVVKTGLQSVQQDFNPQYRGMADCFVKTYRREGIRVFFSGMSATAIRGFPTNAATFYTVVWVRNHMHNSAPTSKGCDV
ncbi:mitochondrial carrier domain-containing protein [Cladochytrium replicatum]|nr:mitochondrial carrier domain-containing protein [Cladochytrium replicatum]